MTNTLYEIIPPEREWDREDEALARRLVLDVTEYRDSDDSRGELAALSLLFRAPGKVWRDSEVSALYRIIGTRRTVMWSRLYLAAVERQVPGATDEEYAALLLACSMADPRCPVRLGDVLGHLTEPTRRAFVAAMAYLCGDDA